MRTRLRTIAHATIVATGIVICCADACAQNIRLASNGQTIREGGSTTIRYNRPDSVTAVRMFVSHGTASSGFNTITKAFNGIVTSSADSVFHWELCSSPDTLERAIAIGYKNGVEVSSDTSYFRVAPPDSAHLQLEYILRDGRKGEDPWADEITGVKTGRGFFATREVHVVSYEVAIAKGGEVLENLTNTGTGLSAGNAARIKKLKGDEIMIHNVVVQHACGVRIPVRNGVRVPYAKKR